jgi:hypothetical protein
MATNKEFSHPKSITNSKNKTQASKSKRSSNSVQGFSNQATAQNHGGSMIDDKCTRVSEKSHKADAYQRQEIGTSYASINYNANTNHTGSEAMANHPYCGVDATNKCNCCNNQCSVIAQPKVSMDDQPHACNPNQSYVYTTQWSNNEFAFNADRGYSTSMADSVYQPCYYDHRQSTISSSGPYDRVVENQDNSSYQRAQELMYPKNFEVGNYHELRMAPNSSVSAKHETRAQDTPMNSTAEGSASTGTNGNQRLDGSEIDVLNCSKQRQFQIAPPTLNPEHRQDKDERSYHSFRSNKSQLPIGLYQSVMSTSTENHYGSAEHIGGFVAVSNLIAQQESHLTPFGAVRVNINASNDQHNNAITTDQSDHSHAYHTKSSIVPQSETRTLSERAADADVARQHHHQQQQQFNGHGRYYGHEHDQRPSGVEQLSVIGDNTSGRQPPATQSNDSGKFTAMGTDHENHLSSSSGSSSSSSSLSLTPARNRFAGSPLAQQQSFCSSNVNAIEAKRPAGTGANQITTINWSVVTETATGGVQNNCAKTDHFKCPASNAHSIPNYQQHGASAAAISHQSVQQQQSISMNNYQPQQASMKYEQNNLGMDKSASVSFNQSHPELERHCVDGADYILAQQQPTSQIMGQQPNYVVVDQPHHPFSGNQQITAPTCGQPATQLLHPIIY